MLRCLWNFKEISNFNTKSRDCESAIDLTKWTWQISCGLVYVNPSISFSNALLPQWMAKIDPGSHFMARMNTDTFRHLCNIQHTALFFTTWWRHQKETFSALLALCAGNSLVAGEFPAQKPVTRSFNVFFDLRLNKRLSKQPWERKAIRFPQWQNITLTWYSLVMIVALVCRSDTHKCLDRKQSVLENECIVIISPYLL